MRTTRQTESIRLQIQPPIEVNIGQEVDIERATQEYSLNELHDGLESVSDRKGEFVYPVHKPDSSYGESRDETV